MTTTTLEALDTRRYTVSLLATGRVLWQDVRAGEAVHHVCHLYAGTGQGARLRAELEAAADELAVGERRAATVGREGGVWLARIRDDAEDLPTGCAWCLDRIAGRRRAACPSHGDEYEVARLEAEDAYRRLIEAPDKSTATVRRELADGLEAGER